MNVAALLLLFLGSPALAGEDTASEVRRLSQDIKSLAQRNAWDGVERKYRELLALQDNHPQHVHMLGADAARNRGDVSSTLDRLSAANEAEASEDIAGQIATLHQEFALVMLRCDPCEVTLNADAPPFRPDFLKAIEFATEAVNEKGRWRGYLPSGSYTYGIAAFTATAGEELVLVQSGKNLEVEPMSVEELPAKVGKARLAGAATFSDETTERYLAALYLSKKVEGEAAAIASEEEKAIVLHFLADEMTEDQLIAHLGQALNAHDVGFANRPRIQALTFVLEDMSAGDTLTLHWLPDRRGVVLEAGKRELGIIKGSDFMKMMWRIYLGPVPFDKEMKAAMLGPASE